MTFTYKQLGCKCLLLLSLSALQLVAGCANTTHSMVPEAEKWVEQDFDYLIGPGDTVEIFVWGNPELTTSAPVRPDGKITTRLVEDIPASGRSPTQMARDIEVAYSKYVKDVVASVSVKGFVGIPSQQVRIVGEASEPKSVPFKKHMSLLDLMISVGGLTEFAAGNKTVLIRGGREDQRMYTLRVEDLIKDGDITANVALMPGDIVIIPESWF